MINQITQTIFIGEYSDSINLETLKQNKINIILNLREYDNPKRREIYDKLHIRQIWEPVISDPDEDFADFMLEVESALYQLNAIRFADGDIPTYLASKILVHCTAEMDRSPFIVALYLYKYENPYGKITFREAYDLVKEKRKGAPVIQHFDWYEKGWKT